MPLILKNLLRAASDGFGANRLIQVDLHAAVFVHVGGKIDPADGRKLHVARRVEFRKGRFDRKVDRLVNWSFLCKSHFQLCRMNIHIHRRTVQTDAQHAGRVLADHDRTLARFLERPLHGVAADVAPVDKENLHGAVGAGIDRLGDKPLHADIVVAVFDGNQSQGEFPAVDRVNGGAELAVAGCEKNLLPLSDEAEGDFGMGERHAVDDGGNGVALCLVGFEEFPSRGGVEEHLAHDDSRADRAAYFLIDNLVAALDDVMHAHIAVGGAGDQLHF